MSRLKYLLYGLEPPVILYLLALLSVLPLSGLDRWGGTLVHLILVLSLYGWNRIGNMESQADKQKRPICSTLLAHLPYMLLAAVDLSVTAGWLIRASGLWEMLLLPLRFPISSIFEVVRETYSLWTLFTQYALNLGILMPFFYLGQRNLPLRRHTMLPLALGAVLPYPQLWFVLWMCWVICDLRACKN